MKTSLAPNLGKNLIINPSFDIWQRNTVFNAASNGTYLADRFLLSETLATGVLNIARSTDVPSESSATYSLKATVATAQPVVAAGEYAAIVQRVEGYNFRKIRGKSAILAFWVKAPIAGEYSVYFANFDQSRTLVKKYTIAQANTWQKVVIPFVHEDVETWDTTNGIGLYVSFVLASGSSVSTASEEWQSSLLLGSDGQQNVFATLSNEFAITEIQLHEGVDAIPFEEIARDISTEIFLCQRYFETLSFTRITGYSNGNAAVGMPYSFNTPKRIVPSVTNKGTINLSNGATSVTVDLRPEPEGLYGGAFTIGFGGANQNTVDMVSTGDSRGRIEFDAEL